MPKKKPKAKGPLTISIHGLGLSVEAEIAGSSQLAARSELVVDR